MSNDTTGLSAPPGLVKARAVSVKTIAAQSESRNSFTRILIGGWALGLLGLALFICLIWRPENVRDVLIIFGSIAGYMLGGVEIGRRTSD
jgi:hypothetical protein